MQNSLLCIVKVYGYFLVTWLQIYKIFLFIEEKCCNQRNLGYNNKLIDYKKSLVFHKNERF